MCGLSNKQTCANDTHKKATRVAIVTNMPTPYRIPIFQKLANHYGTTNFKVIYCTEKECNRDWLLDQDGFDLTYLKENAVTWKNRFIHFNFDVLKALTTYKPDIIITTGFYPTSLIAFAYTLFFTKKHIAWTDGTINSEQTLSVVLIVP